MKDSVLKAAMYVFIVPLEMRYSSCSGTFFKSLYILVIIFSDFNSVFKYVIPQAVNVKQSVKVIQHCGATTALANAGMKRLTYLKSISSGLW